MSNQHYLKGRWKKGTERQNQYHKSKDYYIQEVPISSREALESNQSQLESSKADPVPNESYLLFPGELYEYSERTNRTDLFEVRNGLQITKKPSLLTLDSKGNQSLNVIGRYYSPKENDIVIGIVTGKMSETYKIDIGTYANAFLNKKEIDGNKNSKLEYEIGDLVLCKGFSINKNDTPQLTCLNGKQKEVENYCDMAFGKLANGTIYPIDINKVPLLSKRSAIIKTIKEKLKGTVSVSLCVGDNGRMWINCDKINMIKKVYQVLNESMKKKNEEMNISIDIDKLLSLN